MFDKITALYCRYSRDDGQEEENASITHQRELLKEYAENNGYTNLRCYADDGYSRYKFQSDLTFSVCSVTFIKDLFPL